MEKVLFEYFLSLLGQVKIYHWTTMNFASHKALDELHENLSDNIDKIMEIYIGKFNRQPIEAFNVTMKANSNVATLITFLESERENLRGMRNKNFKNCSEIQNLIDNMLGDISRTIYLCRLS